MLERGIGLDRVAGWMATAPAALTGLADRGAIRPGLRADLCCIAPGEKFVVDPAALRHRNPVTPYAGRTLTGVGRQTWLAGRPAGPGPGAGDPQAGSPRAGQLARPAVLPLQALVSASPPSHCSPAAALV